MMPKVLCFFIMILSSINYLNLVERDSLSDNLILSILPLGEISDHEVEIVKDSLRVFCNCEVKILDRIIKPDPIMNFVAGINPFQKNVFEFLESFSASEEEKILAITNIPFKQKANDSSEPTIRGLTRKNSSIISNVQIIKDAETYDINYNYLLAKVVKHELGHILGIINLTGKFGHCSDTLCIMTSSFPSPENFIMSKYFCDSCVAILKKNIELR